MSVRERERTLRELRIQLHQELVSFANYLSSTDLVSRFLVQFVVFIVARFLSLLSLVAFSLSLSARSNRRVPTLRFYALAAFIRLFVYSMFDVRMNSTHRNLARHLMFTRTQVGGPQSGGVAGVLRGLSGGSSGHQRVSLERVVSGVVFSRSFPIRVRSFRVVVGVRSFRVRVRVRLVSFLARCQCSQADCYW